MPTFGVDQHQEAERPASEPELVGDILGRWWANRAAAGGTQLRYAGLHEETGGRAAKPSPTLRT